MTFKTLCKVILALPFWFAAAVVGQTPEWIWHSSGTSTPHQTEIGFFRKKFSCGFTPQKAELICTGDDEITVFLNGQQVAHGDDFKKPVKADVRSFIVPGENVLAAFGKNKNGAAGVIVKMELRSPNNSPFFVVTDKSWTSSAEEIPGWNTIDFDGTNWPAAVSLGQLGVAPWGDVFEKPTATPAESLTLLPGFKAELIKSAERDEGSWICMTFDPKGRLIISPEKHDHPMLRITLARSGQVSKVERIAAPVHGAMGLLYAFNSLYVNGYGPKGAGLYRLIDKNKNDQFDADEYELLKNIDGDTEHGYHALLLGPDKKIYMMNGNFTKLAAGIGTDSPHRNYTEDLLLPRQWDANGHAKGILAPGGHVLCTDRDGKRWEMLCGGFRNAYDFDFSPNGELFTFDSDMEWDVGAPWYRPTRINHCVSGGEYGWRSGTGKWPTYYPDSLPGNLDIGLSSPTGVKFGTKSKFSPKYRDALFACDWAYGKIFAVHLKPDGASYSGAFETFVSGKPLNAVDVEFGPDGAMYFIIGGWKTQSGLYRISYVGPLQKKEPLSARQKAEARLAAKQRAVRRKLESFHRKKNPAAIDFAWPYLDDPDRWLRFAARVAIESQDVSLWHTRALAEKRTNAATTALIALARCGDKTLQPQILKNLIWQWQRTLDEQQRLEVLRAFQLCFIRMGKPTAELAATVTGALSVDFPAQMESLNRELCQLLVYLESPDALPKTMALMAAAPTQQEQMHYAFVLRNVTNGWTMEQRTNYFAWFNKALSEYKGGASFEKFLVNIRNDAEETLSVSERTNLAAILQMPVAPKQPAIPARSFVRQWNLKDLLPDLIKVSAGRSFPKAKEAFAAAQCISCHRIGNDGGSVGPELTGVSGRFGRRDLLENILFPSKVISDRYQNVTITKRDGDEATGCVTEETNDKIVLITNLLSNRREEILKKDIQSRTVSQLSPMPEGLLNVLTENEILDLLAFLESDGKSSSRAFESH